MWAFTACLCNGSAISRFIRGYFLWGFLPLAILLSILRALHVFYFGNLSPLNSQILGWGALWFVFFLLVGLIEEYSLRGYFLYTLADGIGFWPAAIIQAVLFARAHMGNGGETRIGIIATGGLCNVRSRHSLAYRQSLACCGRSRRLGLGTVIFLWRE